MNMIERVAIFMENKLQLLIPFSDYEVLAKAAIAAMSEPTAAMVMAGYNCNIRNSGLLFQTEQVLRLQSIKL